MKAALFAGLILASVLLGACAAQRPGQQAFHRVMDAQLGKRADDADFYPRLYRLRQAESRPLANGNLEEVYRAGRKGQCDLVFETAPGTRRVLAWRIHGPTGDCVIEPLQR